MSRLTHLHTEIVQKEWKNKIARHKRVLAGEKVERHHVYARPNPMACPITDAEHMAVVKNFHTQITRSGSCRCGYGDNPMEVANGAHFARCRVAQKWMAKKHWMAARQFIIARLNRSSASRFSMGMNVYIKIAGFPLQIRINENMWSHKSTDAIVPTLTLLWRHKDFAFLEDGDAAADFCAAVEMVTLRDMSVTFNFDRCHKGDDYKHVDLSNRTKMFDEYCMPVDATHLP